MTPAQYAPFITTVDTTVGQIYSEMDAASTWREIAEEHPMTGGSQITMGWTGLLPKPRPWFGSRVVHEPAPQTYTVSPIPYELTTSIDQFILDDSDVNAMSIFWRQLPDVARSWRRHPDYEIRDLLEGAGVQTSDGRQNGLDQLSYFNTAHPIDFYNPNFNNGSSLFSAGTYCNDFIGTQTIGGTVIGGAMGTVAMGTLLEYMSMVPGEDGEVLGVTPDTVYIPNTLRTVTRFVLQSTLLASPTWGGFGTITGQVGTADNQLAKMGLKIVVNPFLRKTLRWYLADTSVRKPLYWIVREAPRTVPRINPDDPIVFDSHRFTWGGWDRTCPAWNFSWLMSRSGPSGA